MKGVAKARLTMARVAAEAMGQLCYAVGAAEDNQFQNKVSFLISCGVNEGEYSMEYLQEALTIVTNHIKKHVVRLGRNNGSATNEQRSGGSVSSGSVVELDEGLRVGMRLLNGQFIHFHKKIRVEIVTQFNEYVKSCLAQGSQLSAESKNMIELFVDTAAFTFINLAVVTAPNFTHLKIPTIAEIKAGLEREQAQRADNPIMRRMLADPPLNRCSGGGIVSSTSDGEETLTLYADQ